MRYTNTIVPYIAMNVTAGTTPRVQINYTTYEQLKHNSVLWFCSCCGLTNYSRCLFSNNITTPNQYSALQSLPDSSNQTNSTDDGSPTFTTNPANTSNPDRANTKTKSKLKAMPISCNSVKSTAKVSQLQETINSTNPDILFLGRKEERPQCPWRWSSNSSEK